jgi:hypothetical protein
MTGARAEQRILRRPWCWWRCYGCVWIQESVIEAKKRNIYLPGRKTLISSHNFRGLSLNAMSGRRGVKLGMRSSQLKDTGPVRAQRLMRCSSKAGSRQRTIITTRGRKLASIPRPAWELGGSEQLCPFCPFRDGAPREEFMGLSKGVLYPLIPGLLLHFSTKDLRWRFHGAI